MRLCGSALHLPRVPADVTNHHRVAGRKPSETVAPKSVIQDRVRSRDQRTFRRRSLLSCLGYFTEATCKWITFTSV